MDTVEYSVPPTQEPKKSWFSRHMILGIVFLLAVIGAVIAGLYYRQVVSQIPSSYSPIVHKDATANWKTYTNDQYGFSFKYPDNLIISLTPTGVIKVIDKKDQNKEVEFGSVLWIYIKPNSDALSLQDWWGKNGFKDSTTKPIKVNNIKALQAVVDPTGVPETHILLKYNDKVIDILDNLPQTNQILSTFKFTDSSTSVDSSTWKKYTSDQYGFEFKYPGNWTTSDELKLDSIFNLIGSKKGVGDVGGDQVDFEVSSNPKNLSLSAWIKENIGFEGTDQSIKIDSVVGIKRTGIGQISGESSVFIFVMHGNEIISFSTVGDSNVSILNQTLSTFKFTK